MSAANPGKVPLHLSRGQALAALGEDLEPVPGGLCHDLEEEAGGERLSALFLEKARRRGAPSLSGKTLAEPAPGDGLSDTRIARLAHWSGPWEVERVPAGDGWLHAATRRSEPACEGGAAPASPACGARTRC